MTTRMVRDEWGDKYKATDDAAHVVDGVWGIGKTLEFRLLTFDASADMPADITDSANVSADRVEVSSLPAGVRLVVARWHGLSGLADDGTNLYAPAAVGAIITLGAGDDATANSRLTQSDVTGGGTSSSGIADTVMISAANPIAKIDIGPDATLSRIDVIGVPVGITHGTPVFAPCYLELELLS